MSYISICPHGVMDSTKAYGAFSVGSSPTEGTEMGKRNSLPIAVFGLILEYYQDRQAK